MKIFFAKIKAIYTAKDTERPEYNADALPEGNNGLGLMLLGVTGDQVLPADVYARCKTAALSSVRHGSKPYLKMPSTPSKGPLIEPNETGNALCKPQGLQRNKTSISRHHASLFRTCKIA